MSTTHSNTRAKPNRHLATLKLANLLLLTVLACELFFVVPVSAQATEAAGSISGTVVDVNNDPVPDASVVLQGPTGDRLTVVTRDDGAFAFHDVTPGIAYQITITAEGFAEWNSSVTVGPGQNKTLAEVKLRIVAVQRAVTVGYSSKEVAAQQLQAEEQQRVLRFIPNLYVVYEPHPEPLTTRMKFELAYKDLTHPVFYARMAGLSGFQQAADTPDWPQNAKGYGKRFGANLAGGASEDLFGNAILPSLLHQDPRYFYQGTGTKKSRALHAILASFVCPGDNGKLQPNYSTWGGSLISSSISTAYYPESDRSGRRVFKSFGTGMALHVAGSLAQEFILGKFTSRGKH